MHKAVLSILVHCFFTSGLWAQTSDSLQSLPLFDLQRLDKKGVYATAKAGYSSGSNRLGRAVSAGRHLYLTGGYQLHKNWFAGLGLAYDLHEVDEFTDLRFVPIFLEVRHHFFHRVWSPYLELGMGYALPLSALRSVSNAQASGGWTFHPRIGMKLSPNFLEGLLLFAGYKWQQTTLIQDDINQTGDLQQVEALQLRRLEMGMGFLF